MSSNKCQCHDPLCPVHVTSHDCPFPSDVVVYRTDMFDVSGTHVCKNCAEDMFEYGPFSTDPPTIQ